MYEAFFNFKSRPFVATPITRCYFPAGVIENSRQSLVRLVERGEGVGLIIGPPGTGKTLLCHLLAEQFRSRFSVALLTSGRQTSCQAMFQAILFELGLPYRGLDEGELRLSLMDYLRPAPGGNQGLLLIVDEAHRLGWRLLEEVRMLTNVVRDGQPRVRVVLAGSANLEERFASPKLSAFSQRVASRCYLESLNSSETTEYVKSQISNVGGDPNQLIDVDALRSIYRATDGIPRLINQICDHALVLCSLGGQRRLTNEAVEEAWADLQQLPAAWTPATVDESAASQIVEFGRLDEEPEAIPFRASERHTEALHLAESDDSLDDELDSLSADSESGSVQFTARTEVDLDFPEFGDPFGEEFAEEELVLDPYHSSIEIFADVPRVSSWEGYELGSMLEPLEECKQSSTRIQLSDSASYEEQTADEDLTDIEEDESVEMIEASSAAQQALPPEPFLPASDPVYPEDMASDELSSSEIVLIDAAPPSQTTSFVDVPFDFGSLRAEQSNFEQRVADRRKSEPPTTLEVAIKAESPFYDQLAAQAAEQEVIIVEDDIAPTATMPTIPRARTSKPEFRQLFAKLRRG